MALIRYHSTSNEDRVETNEGPALASLHVEALNEDELATNEGTKLYFHGILNVWLDRRDIETTNHRKCSQLLCLALCRCRLSHVD